MSGRTRKELLAVFLGATALAGGATVVSGAALAQTAEGAANSTQIETVVVTARRRAEDQQKVPVAVTALDQASLDRDQIRANTDLKIVTPSLNVASSYGAISAGYSIRGLSQGQFSGPSVTSYFSEAPTSAPGGTPLYDLTSAQVLRGPQGTLFGRATTGGAILFSPQHPDFDRLSGSVDVMEGTLGTNIITGVLNIPIDDELAVRVAGHLEQMDGYEHVIGTNQALSSTNRQSLRIGVEWHPVDWFQTYTVADLNVVAQTTAPQILSGYDPTNTLLNLPSSTATPLGAIYGPALFGAICAGDVANGYATSATACEDQRLGILSTYKPALAAELARVNKGGNAVRYVVANQTPYPNVEDARSYMFVNNSQVDLGDLGFSNVTLKNNFSYSLYDDMDCEYVGIPNHYIESCFDHASSYAKPGTYVPRIGPLVGTLTEEFQVNGSYDDDLLVWLVGFYYSGGSVPSQVMNGTVGCNNLYHVFGGVLAPNYGFGCANTVNVGGYSWERGLFGNAVLDLSRWIVPGLHLTGGIRTTTDQSGLTVGSYTTPYPSLAPTLTGVTRQPDLKSSGLGWNAALDEQVNDDLLVYVTSSRGYKPGGHNNSVGAAGAPSYTPTYAPETVIDLEVGAKDRFEIGGVKGILNVNLYRNWFSNIQEPLVNSAGGLVFQYTENVAAAILQGVEVETTIIPDDNWQITGNYSYNDNHFTRYFAADPLGFAKPGNPACVAAYSTPTSCDIDLSSNPFPLSAAHQGRLTVQYKVPVTPHYGDVFLSLTAYAQSREYWTSAAARNIQVYGPSLGVANVRDQISQPAYALLNARLEWDNIFGSTFNGSIWVNNLTDQIYSVGGFDQLNSLAVNGKWYAPPRTAGVELKYAFGN